MPNKLLFTAGVAVRHLMVRGLGAGVAKSGHPISSSPVTSAAHYAYS